MANKHKISIFDLFVASKDNRPNLAKPFRVGDWIGATNSFIAMRVPASLVDTDLQENESRIEAEKFNGFFGEFGEGQEVDVKKWDTLLQTLRTVQEFKPRETCPACDGEGTVECDHCGNEYDCKRCHGEGEVGPHIPTGRMTYQSWNTGEDLYIDGRVSVSPILMQACLDTLEAMKPYTNAKMYCYIDKELDPVRFEIRQPNYVWAQFLVMPLKADLYKQPKINLTF